MFDADIRYLEDKRDKDTEKCRLKSGRAKKDKWRREEKRGWCTLPPRSDAVVGKRVARQGLKRKTD